MTPPVDEERCRHELLTGQCSVCGGLDDRATLTGPEAAGRPDGQIPSRLRSRVRTAAGAR